MREYAWQDEDYLIDQWKGGLGQSKMSDGDGIERTRQDAETTGADASAA